MRILVATDSCYAGAMRLALVALVLAASPAFAINWEGHDDWLADQPAAEELRQRSGIRPPPLKPRLPRACHPRGAPLPPQANPYEPVPMLCPEPSITR